MKFIRNFLIILLLLFLGFYNRFQFLKAEDFGILNLNVRGAFSDLTASTSGELLAGNIVTGRFHTDFPNLGIVSVRFFNNNRDSDDVLLFRLKEEGENGWYYEARYKTDQFQPHKLFPFGFPVIRDSAGKKYIFEIESLYGEINKGILIDYQKPVFIAKSQFTRQGLLDNPNLLRYFLPNKLINIIWSSDAGIYSFLLFMPLLLYFVYLLLSRFSYQLLSSLVFGLVIYDIFYLKEYYLMYYISVFLLWILTKNRYNLVPGISILLAIGGLALVPVLHITNGDQYLEKVALWSNIFILSAVFQHLFQLILRPKLLLSLYSFVRRFPVLEYYGRLVPYKKIQLLSGTFFLCSASILFILTLRNIISKMTIFKDFYPESYLLKYTGNLLAPILIIFVCLVAIFHFSRKLVKKAFSTIFILSLSFFLISGRIVSHSISFENTSRIISVNPSEVKEAWTDIVLEGKNFRDVPFVGKILIDGVEQGEYIVYWSDEKIIFRTSPELTKTGWIQVVPQDRPPSNKVPFTYTYMK